MYFIGKCDDPSTEEYIIETKSTCHKFWKLCLVFGLRNDAMRWWRSLDTKELLEQ